MCGGKKDGSFIEPTVITNTKQDMKVICEEVFAPVVIVEPYADFDDALKKVNRSYYGLQAGLFCNDLKKIQKAYMELEVGGLIINDFPTFRVDNMPYGGTKDSGMGREGIRNSIEEMTQPKLLVLRF